ncbi:MAG: glucuronate isomerase [Saccharofermentanales bacterium]
MKTFITPEFLLENKSGYRLYREHAADLPILDYHCHIPADIIAADESFCDITDLWLSGDHYKWRLMRLCGISEERITGKADSEDRFVAWAQTLERSPGNPLYHWAHMELLRYFGCDEVLTSDNAREIHAFCNRQLLTGSMTPQSIIADSNVHLVCTTDDPAGCLDSHQKIRDAKQLDARVIPTFRPDKYIKIQSGEFAGNVQTLYSRWNQDHKDFDGYLHALLESIAYFKANGCISADFGLEYIPCRPASRESVVRIFDSAMSGESINAESADIFITYMLRFFATEFVQNGWVMQLHIGAARNINSRRYAQSGPDFGFDAIAPDTGMESLARFLDSLEADGILPKTILFSLNPGDDEVIDTLCGCFSRDGVRGVVQHGVAWWFNDTKQGIENHLIRYASLGVLGNHLGMLTDSRSLLSYVRHDYFRRILCNLIGGWTEGGQLALPENKMKDLITGICHTNISDYLGFE